MEIATMECAEIRESLPAYVRDGEVGLAVRRHVAHCADCKGELGDYVALLAGLDELKSAVIEPPLDLVANLVAIPSTETPVDVVRQHVVRNRRAYAGGLAVAAVGIAGAALLKSRRSRPALA
ncbi:MAG: hypothetical protein QOG54_1745 [Actinomycetota bacterium]|jgi:hypothetical protein|nr:hypothetical protein [Actinomycetota bacterium]